MVRFKNRFVLVEVRPVARAGGRSDQLQRHAAEALHCAVLARALKEAILANFGELGVGLLASLHGTLLRANIARLSFSPLTPPVYAPFALCAQSARLTGAAPATVSTRETAKWKWPPTATAFPTLLYRDNSLCVSRVMHMSCCAPPRRSSRAWAAADWQC